MSTHGQFNTKSPTIKRILREAAELSSSSSSDYTAAPLDSNLFEWHFTIRGPPAPSPFSTGIYHGRIILPPTYPLRPPSFRFLTPSGRFEPNREICLSISGHHEESWQPAWGIRTALVAIRSFMDTEAKGQVGGVEASKDVRRRFAGESRRWKCGGACAAQGKALEDVMREREEEVDGGEVQKVEEEEVPSELRLGYRDEMEKASKDAGEKEKEVDGSSIASLDGTLPMLDGTASSPVYSAQVSDAAALTLDAVTPTSKTSDSNISTSPSSNSALELQPNPPVLRRPHTASSLSLPPTSPPTPTSQRRTTTLPRQQTQPPAQRLRQTPATASNWLDLAIVGIAAALGALIIRKLLL